MRVRILLLLGALVASGSLALAQSTSYIQALTISGTAASRLTATAGLTFCRGVVEGGNIRMALDGSTVTASTGRPVLAGERLLLNNGPDITNLSVIATSAPASISMSCGAGTSPAISVVESPPNNYALPVCNALTRLTGNCRS